MSTPDVGTPHHAAVAGGAARSSSASSTASPRFEAVVVGFGAVMVAGVYLVLWADTHGRLDDTALSAWHVPAYAALVGLLLFLVLSADRAMRHGRGWRTALPEGYGVALLGVGILALYPVLDVVWSATVDRGSGISGSLRLSSLLIPAGLVLIAAAPLRSPARADRMPKGGAATWARLPSIIASGLLLAALTIPVLPLSPLSGTPAGSTGDAADTPGLAVWENDRHWSGIRTISVDRKVAVRLTVGDFGREASWSPDGERIVYSSVGDVALMRANGTGQRILARTTQQEGWFTWSPDSKRIAYMAPPPRAAGAGEAQPEAPTPAPGQFGPLSPDGLSSGGAGGGGPSVGEYDLWIRALDGSGPVQLTNDPGLEGGPSWSPDGRQIAFHAVRTGDADIWVVAVDGGQQRQLTDAGAEDLAPAWSPDGTRIAFTSDRGGDYEIYSMATDGSDVRQVTNLEGQAWSPGWSPDGGQMSFICLGPGAGAVPEVCTVDLASGVVAQYTDDPRYENLLSSRPWSPDGTMLLLSSRRLTPVEVATVAADLGVDDAFDVARLLSSIAALATVLLLAWHRGLRSVGLIFAVFVLPWTLAALVFDEVRFVPAAVVAAILGELAVRVLRPWDGPRERVAASAAVVVVAWVVAYLVTLVVGGDLRWSPELAIGVSILCAGIGLLLAQLIVAPRVARHG